MRRRIETAKFVIADFLCAALSWAFFFIYRKISIEKTTIDLSGIEIDRNFYYGIVILPCLWVITYFFLGNYKNVFRKSRLKELGDTLYVSLLGCVIIFFAVILDDEVVYYKNYYYSFATLFTLQFSLTAISRFLLSSSILKRMLKGKLGFKTLLIGSDQTALSLFKEISEKHKSQGNLFAGYIRLDETGDHLLNLLPNLGSLKNLVQIVQEEKIEEVIIAVESAQHNLIQSILTTLEDRDVVVKIIPDLYDILSGSVRITAIFGAPLIEINPVLMPQWQQSFKRTLDIATSIIVLFFFFPVFLVTAIIVKLTSRGPIFYSHDRIGLHGQPFRIFKFRSMYHNAESNGPMLSSKTDLRITKFGKFMRKTRLDEIPQFYNVLKGDMSIVGPRPEREYFIDKIIEKAPHYKHLHKVRPGITSWGQVKYGYAENVDQMVDRLKFDLMYIENMSIALDLKILIYTVLIVVQGRGK